MTVTASVSGNWSNTATWGGSAVPVDNDAVAINAGITVVFDVDQSGFANGIAGITLGAGSVLAMLPTGTPTGPNGAVYLQLKTGTNISGTGGIVRLGAPSSGTAVVDAAVVEYAAWPAAGTAVTNTGTAGAGYNGVLAANEYSVDVLTGYTKQANTANTTDYIKIPHGASVDNLGAHTLEFKFYLNALTTNQRVFSKGDAYYYGYIPTAGTTFLIYRYDTAGTAYKLWTVTYTFVAGGFYDIQIAWDATSVDDAHNPTVKINNVVQTAVLTKSGTVTAWRDDSAQDLYIANNAAHTSYSSCTHFIDRVHTRLLTDAEQTTNYYADMAHYAGVPITRPTAVTSLLVDDAVYNKSGQLVVKCTSAANFVAGGIIYLVNGAESGSPSTSLRETLTIAAAGVDLVNNKLTCTGNLVNSYTAAAGAYVTQKTIPRAALNIAGAAAAAGVTATGAHTVAGWYPTTGYSGGYNGSSSNAWCPLAADAAIGQGYIDIMQDMGFNAGEQILIGSGVAGALDGANCLYTITKYETAGGVGGVPRVHIYPVLATTARVGGHTPMVTPEANDYCCWYSRPILLSRTNAIAGYMFTSVLPANATVTGVRISKSNGLSTASGIYGVTSRGITIDGQNTVLGTSNYYNYRIYDAVSYYLGTFNIGGNGYCSGCIAILGSGFSDTATVVNSFVNTNNSTSRFIVPGTTENCVVINPVVRYGSIIGATPHGNHTIIGARTTGTLTDLYLTTPASANIYLYNSTLGQTPVSGYNSLFRPVNSVIQSINAGAVAGSHYLWCRGGTATTNQATQVYGTDTYGTMKFTTDGTIVNTPLIWDTWFWMPPNKSISFNVPMYATTAEGITAAVWIIDPSNDPLWFQQFPSVTFTPSTPTVGTATGNVLAVSAMPTPSSAFVSVPVTVPAQTYGRELICRIIFMGTTASTSGYAYLGYMQNALMQRRKVMV